MTVAHLYLYTCVTSMSCHDSGSFVPVSVCECVCVPCLQGECKAACRLSSQSWLQNLIAPTLASLLFRDVNGDHSRQGYRHTAQHDRRTAQHNRRTARHNCVQRASLLL